MILATKTDQERPRVPARRIHRNAMYFALHPYAKHLAADLKSSHSVLDLGCGYTSSLQYLNVPYSVGVDIEKSALEKSKKKKSHTEYICADLSTIEFPQNSFDVVLATDCVEHLAKDGGYNLISKMEKWARQKVILF